MASKEFIFQGFTARTHGAAVRELFDVGKVKSVSISVAFVNEAGVEHIENAIKPYAKVTSVFAGIRNEITSYQGLARLHGLVGERLHTVDTGSRMRIFHPKLFVVRGSKRARMLIGSANLTLGGLNNNVEASLALNLDLADAEDLAILEDVEAKIAAMAKDYPKHVAPVVDIPTLKKLLESDRIIDEDAAPPPRLTSPKGVQSGKDDIGPISLKVKPLRSKIKVAKKVAKKTVTVAGGVAKAPSYLGALEKVWESKPLSARSLNIKTGSNTNPTGSTTLGKGRMPEIDPTTYFREDVFGHLAWEDYTNRAGNPAQKADVDFEIIIKGVPIGRFNLTLRHSLTRVAAAAKDKNVPTELHWNDARLYISKLDLIERSMTIHRDVSNPLVFAVSID